MKVVDVFADVWCPFTHVGLRRIVARREMLGRSDVVFHVRAWPLELENGRPFEADFIAEEVDALRAQVAGDLFTGFEPAHFPSTTLPPPQRRWRRSATRAGFASATSTPAPACWRTGPKAKRGAS
jgi:hypothetical protein